MSPPSLERGDVLFHEGDQGDRLYVIGEGKIKLGRTSGDGRENLLAILGPGEMFGELSPVRPRPPHRHRHRGRRDPADRPRPRRRCDAFLAGRPEVASTLLAALARRLRRTNETLADLVFTDVPGRVAKALLDLPTGSAAPPRTASSSPTTSPRRSSPSSSAPPARRSTRPWPTSPRRGWIKLEARAVVLLDVERLKRRAR